MKIADVLEEKHQIGTYAGVHFSEKTKNEIHEYMQLNHIPNELSPSKLHTTLLYSRKYLPDYKAVGKYDKPMIGIPGNFDIWKSNGEDGEPTNCLIVEFECEELNERHDNLMKEHKATYDYPKYKTHITLSYDCGELDPKKLMPFKKIVKKIEIVEEYQEILDLNWAKNKGTSK